MSLKTTLKHLLGIKEPSTRKPEGYIAEHYYGVPVDEDIHVKSPSIDLPPPVMPHGRIVKADKHQQYRPDVSRSGGRVVKAMPRELKLIKAAQEKTSGDES